MKHGYRKGSVFPKPNGPPSHVNLCGEKALQEILQSANKIYLLKDGSIKIYNWKGQGAHFSNRIKLIGFVEKQYEKTL